MFPLLIGPTRLFRVGFSATKTLIPSQENWIPVSAPLLPTSGVTLDKTLSQLQSPPCKVITYTHPRRVIWYHISFLRNPHDAVKQLSCLKFY